MKAVALLAPVLAAAILVASCTPGSTVPIATTPAETIPGATAPGATAPSATPLPGDSAGPGMSTPPGGSPAPTATSPTGPWSEDAAVALVLSQDPRFAGIGRRDPTLIGQGSWYEVRALGGAFEVTVRIGWGDCPAGCISNHTWVYAVGRDGSVRLVRESGDELPAGGGVVVGLVTAGPACPVERDPPDPACAPRPVEGAVLVATAPDGREAARATAGPDGRYEMRLLPGAYRLVPQPVEGLMGTPGPIEFRVSADPGEVPQRLDVAYDTGIR